MHLSSFFQKILILNISLGFLWSQFWNSPSLFLLFASAMVATLAFRSVPLPTVEPLGSVQRKNLIWGLLALVPSFVTLVLGWNSEFPFSGDYDHHVLVFQRLLSQPAYLWWLPISLMIGFFWLGHRHWSSGFVALSVLFFLSSFYQGPVQDVARYPTGFYFVSGAPWLLMDLFAEIRAYEWQKWMNFLSLPVGLFVLRPFLIRRWPDAQGAVLFLILTLQKDLNYFFNSNYLEPWSVVLVAISVEAFLLESRTRVQSLATLSVACLFKEQAVFFLGAGWLAFAWSEKNLVLWKRLLIGFQLLAPFLIYFLIRKSGGVWRTTEIVPFSESFNSEQLVEYAFRIQLHLAPTGFLLLLVTFLGLALALHRGLLPRSFWVFSLAAGFLMFLSFADRISMEYAGYPRFHFFGWALLAALCSFLFGKFITTARRRALAFVLVLAALLPGSTDYWSRMRGPWDRMGALEHYKFPVFFPIRELLTPFDRSYPFNLLLVNNPFGDHKIQTGFFAGYSDLFPSGVSVQIVDASKECVCSNGAVMQLNPRIHSPLNDRRPLESQSIDSEECSRRMRQTCKERLEVRDSSGGVWGVLGLPQ